MTANGAIVMSRYRATLPLLSAVAAAKNSVLASATAMQPASTAKLATTGQVNAVNRTCRHRRRWPRAGRGRTSEAISRLR